MDKRAIRSVISRVRSSTPVEIELKHPEEMERLLEHLDGQRQNPDINRLLQMVEEQEASIISGLLRLIAVYTGSPLPPSKSSEEFYQRIEVRLRAESNGIILLTGQDAIDAVQADLDAAVDFSPEIETLLVDAVTKYLQYSVLNGYGFIRGVRNEDAEFIDPEFIDFLLEIPIDWKDLVDLIAYPKNQEANSVLECGAEGIPVFGLQSSKFVVPLEAWPNSDSRSIIAAGGIYKLEPPGRYLSGSWWLEHAIWQMLARVSSRTRDSLPLRVDKYFICGRP